MLTNPALNYAQFLLRAIVADRPPCGRGDRRRLCGRIGVRPAQPGDLARAAGGSPLAALVGKLAPLFGVFVLMMVVVAAIIHGASRFRFAAIPC